MNKAPIACCDICGEDLHDGDRAFGTTTGRVLREYDGFTADDSDPWITVTCQDCGDKITDTICQMMKKH